MKLQVILIALVLFFVSKPALAEPYAPVDASMQAFVTAPDAGEVDMPAYPGAKLFSSMEPMMPGSKNHILVLSSKDPKDKVLAFFKEKLKGWTVQTMKFSGDPLIHEGEGEINLFSEEGMSTRHVLLEDGSEPMGQTKITIGYHKK